MENKTTLLIAEDQDEGVQKLCSMLLSKGIEVYTCQKQGNLLLDEIKSKNPDIVLANVFMQGIDLIGVLDGIKKSDLAKKPIVMAISSITNARLESQVLSAGATYYFLKPFDL